MKFERLESQRIELNKEVLRPLVAVTALPKAVIDEKIIKDRRGKHVVLLSELTHSRVGALCQELRFFLITLGESAASWLASASALAESFFGSWNETDGCCSAIAGVAQTATSASARAKRVLARICQALPCAEEIMCLLQCKFSSRTRIVVFGEASLIVPIAS